MKKCDLPNLAKFFSELGMYQRIKVNGPKLVGIAFDEFLSSHIVRAAQIAYILAYLENADPQKTACIVLFHDNGELRVGDQTKVAARYFDIKQAEKEAFSDQVEQLPKQLAEIIKAYYSEFKLRNSKEGVVAKDADWLEVAIFAKEMTEIGYKGMHNWIENVRKALETQSAKDLLEYIEKQEDFTNCWWQGLKKMTYKKLNR
jgi:putative hydrolases of HD superfamily